jgi:hypothetical protein
MRAIIAIVALVVTATTAAYAQDLPNLVPQGWVEEATPNWRGRRFVSPNGQASLTTSSRPANRRSLKREMDAIAYREGERITYQRRGASWIAVSGFKNNRIFYRKSNLACGGRDWHHIELVYPAADKKRMDATVTHIARGMSAYNDQCTSASRGGS